MHDHFIWNIFQLNIPQIKYSIDNINNVPNRSVLNSQKWVANVRAEIPRSDNDSVQGIHIYTIRMNSLARIQWQCFDFIAHKSQTLVIESPNFREKVRIAFVLKLMLVSTAEQRS